MSCVVVFGREPIAGRVKTRLAASVGAEAAAMVYRELLEHTLVVAASVNADLVLAMAEPPAHSFRPPREIAIEIQAAGSLGRRMATTFERRFSEGYRRVVLIGSDCPELEPRHLDDALAALSERPAVLGPASDGGYWLVGLRPPAPDLFSGIAWSTEEVLEATRTRLRAAGVEWLELETLSDLDSGSDLSRLLQGPTHQALAQRLRRARRSFDEAEGR